MASYIARRKFLATILGGAAVAWLLPARAQQPAMPVVGYLTTRAPGEDPHLLAAFHQGLKEAGYIEGQNVAIEFRYAENQYERLPALAAGLVRHPVDVVVAPGIPVALAARAASAKTPVVFLVAVDPVKFGLVASFSRPGGNLTGMTMLGNDLGPKRLELLHELVPTATTIAALINPTSPIAQTQSRDLQAAARTLGVQLHVLHASNERDFDTVFAKLAQLRAEALVIDSDLFFSSRIKQLARLALRHAMPAIYQFRSFAAAGGLMSYGVRITSAYRFVGVYTGRILKGETPADLPVQQSTEVELIINLKTAKALGLTFPLTLLGRADEVIE